MRITHTDLIEWLDRGLAAARIQLRRPAGWPAQQHAKSEWTSLAHYTLACAVQGIYPYPAAADMSLRASRTKHAPTLWQNAAELGVVHDYVDKQMGLDFCLMGPTGKRNHHITAESECDPYNSVAINLSAEGYIWDWSKLLNGMSEHRLNFAVVANEKRRQTLMQNMAAFFHATHPTLKFAEGIGGYVIAHGLDDRDDSYTFIVKEGVLDFERIPPNRISWT